MFVILEEQVAITLKIKINICLNMSSWWCSDFKNRHSCITIIGTVYKLLSSYDYPRPLWFFFFSLSRVPERRPGTSGVPPSSCLESEGCHLIPLLLSLVYLHSPLALSVLSLKSQAYLHGSCWAARWHAVVGRCYVQLATLWHWFLPLCICTFLFVFECAFCFRFSGYSFLCIYIFSLIWFLIN